MSSLSPKSPLLLFFDECCSKHLGKSLYNLYKPHYEGDDSFNIKYISEFVSLGSPDDVWMKFMEQHPSWIVVTRDKGRKQPDLIQLCEEYKRTHLVINHTLDTVERQSLAFNEMWRLINILPYLPPGTGAKMHYTQVRSGLKAKISVQKLGIESWCKENGVDYPPFLPKASTAI